MTASFWLQWQKQFENYGHQPNLKDYHNEMMKQISGISQRECNIVAKALNQALSSLSTENDQWFQQLNQAVVNANNFSENDLIIDENFKITTTLAKNAWNEYNKLNKEFYAIPEELRTQAQIDQLSDAKTLAFSLQGKINKFKGQILETFLASLRNTFINVASEVVINNANDLIEKFAQGIKTADFKSIKSTEGSQKNKDISLTINDTNFTMRGAQQKVDVTLPSPFKNQQQWRISAKNYSSLKNVHLLSGGSFLRLVYSGISPQNKYTFKFLLNALTIPSADWTKQNIDWLKKIFMIQAISGGQLNNMANVMVITINTSKNPFRIISIQALLNDIFESNNLKAIIFTPNLDSILPLGNMQARNEASLEAIRNLKVNASLNKSLLSLSYLTQLANFDI